MTTDAPLGGVVVTARMSAALPNEPAGFQPEDRYRVIRYDEDFGVLTEEWAPAIDDVIEKVRLQLVLADKFHSVSVDVFG